MGVHGCSNHLNLEMKAECLTKKLTVLEFKDLQNKKRYKQAAKSIRTRKSYKTYRLFSFYSDNLLKTFITRDPIKKPDLGVGT